MWCLCGLLTERFAAAEKYNILNSGEGKAREFIRGFALTTCLFDKELQKETKNVEAVLNNDNPCDIITEVDICRERDLTDTAGVRI